jgi:hypothetical protein
VLAACSAGQNAVTAFQTLAPIIARVKQATTAAQTGITLGLLGSDSVVKADFSAARIIRKVAGADRATPETSKITGLTYGRIPTTSLSIPIGRTATTADDATTDNLQGALLAIKAPMIAASPSPNRTKVYLQDEEF